MAKKISVNVNECDNWTVENIAEYGSGRTQMSRYATGTVVVQGFTVCLQKQKGYPATEKNTHITVVHKDGELYNEKDFELIFDDDGAESDDEPDEQDYQE